MHWTQTPEGKKKMAAAQKKSWATRRAQRMPKKKASSKAEALVARTIGNGQDLKDTRLVRYKEIVDTAIAHGEAELLYDALTRAAFEAVMARRSK